MQCRHPGTPKNILKINVFHIFNYFLNLDYFHALRPHGQFSKQKTYKQSIPCWFRTGGTFVIVGDWAILYYNVGIRMLFLWYGPMYLQYACVLSLSKLYILFCVIVYVQCILFTYKGKVVYIWTLLYIYPLWAHIVNNLMWNKKVYIVFYALVCHSTTISVSAITLEWVLNIAPNIFWSYMYK